MFDVAAALCRRDARREDDIVKVPLLDLTAQYAQIREEVRAAMDAVCDSQMFILGARVEEFEREVAAYCGAAHGVGVSSGTDALLVALMALGVGPGDAVVTTPYTFFATVGSIVRVGATPLFADIDPVSYNIDPLRVQELLETPPPRSKGLRIKALMPVHLYGQVADMRALGALARAHDLCVIEDAAQAIGAEYPDDGRSSRAGALGDAGCFSFFPSKNLGGFGDGGLVTLRDDEARERAVRIRNHGAHPKYYHGMVGGNFRLDALQAAVLSVKLRRLEEWHAARRVNAERYDRAFEGSAVVPPAAVYAGQGITNYHIYNQYVVRVPDRDASRAKLTEAGVGNEVYYPVPLHLQECFRDLGYSRGDFPESERAAAETLALPVYPELTPGAQDYVIESLMASC